MSANSSEKGLERDGKFRLQLGTAKVGKKKSTQQAINPDGHRAQLMEAFDDKDDRVPTNGHERRHTEPLVIPKLENTFQIRSSNQPEKDPPLSIKKAKDAAVEEVRSNRDLDVMATQALVREASARGSNENRTSAEHLAAKNVIVDAQSSSSVKPLELRNVSETDQYKADLQNLPEELDLHDYQYRVPIADFGAALLRGMGWKDDEDDKNKKKDDDNALPRPHRLGLGATPKFDDNIIADSSRRRPLRPDQVQRNKDLQAQQREFEKQRERQLALDRQRTLQNGSIVYINRRQRARVIQLVGVPGLNRVRVQLEGEREETIVKRSELGQLVDRQNLLEDPFREKEVRAEKQDDSRRKRSRDKDQEFSQKDDNADKNKRRSESRDSRNHNKHREDPSPSGSRKDGEREKKSKPATWLIPNIRVRVITEKLGRRYYKEKGIVVDVTLQGATIRMDTKAAVLDHVPERYLETALPSIGKEATEGGNVVVVAAGKHRNKKGRLLERNSRKGTCVVQVYEDMSVLTLSLDDIAEWCGPLDDDLA